MPGGIDKLAAAQARKRDSDLDEQAAPLHLIHDSFRFRVEEGPGNRVLVLIDVDRAGNQVLEHRFPFGNLDNADTLGKLLSAPAVRLPGHD